MTAAWPLRIWYDRGCALCRRELHALADHDPRGRLHLVDCSAPGFSDPDLEAAGISVQEAMDVIHARDAQGRWLRGVEVFEACYRAVGLEGVARTLAHPWLRPGWDWLYPRIARNRLPLSRMGLDRPFGWLVRRAARRAMLRTQGCADNACAAAERADRG